MVWGSRQRDLNTHRGTINWTLHNPEGGISLPAAFAAGKEVSPSRPVLQLDCRWTNHTDLKHRTDRDLWMRLGALTNLPKDITVVDLCS